ncbi:hypothetical protein BKA70DRAFT_1370914 [Coprinopsis sp. MPI-PUGE-AT-0042]|nr:hypothetical protein BKA70DRAFT_1370914 [Coprinopsis sp. MPI-PUGE-AT-0042]
MSQLLHWPAQYYFYPFGNTSAVSLTTDLPVDEPACILLLGCGDPRNILFTIFNQPDQSTRSLDFTCCDYDPAILARNILLFTMAIDERPANVIWNVFFHFRLDLVSKEVLISQCEKLIGLSSTLSEWSTSIYGSHLRMCTEHTLCEVRRHWTLYRDMGSLPQARLDAIATAFNRMACGEPASRHCWDGPTLKRASHFDSDAIAVPLQSYPNYWKTGTSFFDKERQLGAVELNPTFAYSLGGEGASFHYGCDPLIPFHLAPIFGNAATVPTIVEVFDGAFSQFDGWCSSYRLATKSKLPPLTIRFFFGDAIAVTRALSLQPTRGFKTSIPVAPWKANEPPTAFNVIHTSNLVDDVGLFNLILAASPLLALSPFAVLYSESILQTGSNATKAFRKSMKADISVMALLLDLVPVDYLCGFTSRSNTHELNLHRHFFKNRISPQVEQFHQVTTWKRPTSGDGHFRKLSHQRLWRRIKGTSLEPLQGSNMAQETRESFVLFLKRAQERLNPNEAFWNETMARFRTLQSRDVATMDGLYFQYLSAQLLLHHVFRSPLFSSKASKIGRFKDWELVPDVVRIILVVPRSALAVLERSGIFSTLSTAFGRVISTGTVSSPKILFEEDSAGWKGSSPLIDPPQDVMIGFGVRNTPAATHMLTSKLGIDLRIYSAKALDETQVHVLPEFPLPASSSGGATQPKEEPLTPALLSQIGNFHDGKLEVRLDEQCELLEEFKAHIATTNEATIRHCLPCVLRVSVGTRSQDVVYPFPVQGDGNRLRLARKSKYIEILVKPSRSLLPGGFAMNPYPPHPWTLHHKSDLLTLVKDSINSILRYATGTQADSALGPIRRLFCLRDHKTRDTDTLFFANNVRFDAGSHTVVLDAYVLNLTLGLIQSLGLSEPFGKLVTEGHMSHITMLEGEMKAWKQLLPALVERCRGTWKHTPNCEYKSKQRTPLSIEEDGKDVEGMLRNEVWAPFGPYVTRFALSPLFGVSYLETVGRSPDAHKCSRCRGKGKPKIMVCARCKRARYCSPGCKT